MRRFFVDNENVRESHVVITGSDVNHIKNVLRMAPGENLVACDKDGSVFVCEIEKITDTEVACRILEKCESDAEPKVPVVLLQGVPKGEKAELIIQKTVELGVSEIWPVLTERTIVKFQTDKDKEKKRERWQKISEEAGKQCGRAIIPEISEIKTFKEALRAAAGEEFAGYLKLIPYENEHENTLKTLLRGGEDIKGIMVFIGPEGGFAEKEIETAISSGFTPVTLGKRILRTETAGMATIAMIRYEIGD